MSHRNRTDCPLRQSPVAAFLSIVQLRTAGQSSSSSQCSAASAGPVSLLLTVLQRRLAPSAGSSQQGLSFSPWLRPPQPPQPISGRRSQRTTKSPMAVTAPRRGETAAYYPCYEGTASTLRPAAADPLFGSLLLLLPILRSAAAAAATAAPAVVGLARLSWQPSRRLEG